MFVIKEIYRLTSKLIMTSESKHEKEEKVEEKKERFLIHTFI